MVNRSVKLICEVVLIRNVIIGIKWAEYNETQPIPNNMINTQDLPA